MGDNVPSIMPDVFNAEELLTSWKEGSACIYPSHATSSLISVVESADSPVEVTFSSLLPGEYIVKVLGVGFSDEYGSKANVCEEFDSSKGFGKSFKKAYNNGSYQYIEFLEEIGEEVIKIGSRALEEITVKADAEVAEDALCLEEESFSITFPNGLVSRWKAEDVQINSDGEITGVEDSVGELDLDVAKVDGGKIALSDEKAPSGHSLIELWTEGRGQAYFYTSGNKLRDLFLSEKTGFTVVSVGAAIEQSNILSLVHERTVSGIVFNRLKEDVDSKYLDFGFAGHFNADSNIIIGSETLTKDDTMTTSVISFSRSNNTLEPYFNINGDEISYTTENNIDGNIADAAFENGNYELKVSGVANATSAKNKFLEVLLFSRVLKLEEIAQIQSDFRQKYDLDYSDVVTVEREDDNEENDEEEGEENGEDGDDEDNCPEDSANLLVNPSAEDGSEGWTLVEGGFNIIGQDCAGDLAGASHGNNYFAVGGVCNGTESAYGQVYQNVLISNDFLSTVADGEATVDLSGDLASWDGQVDVATMSLLFMDEFGNILDLPEEDVGEESLATYGSSQWESHETSLTIPQGTSTIRLTLEGERGQTVPDNDSYFDNLELTVSASCNDDNNEGDNNEGECDASCEYATVVAQLEGTYYFDSQSNAIIESVLAQFNHGNTPGDLEALVDHLQDIAEVREGLVSEISEILNTENQGVQAIDTPTQNFYTSLISTLPNEHEFDEDLDDIRGELQAYLTSRSETYMASLLTALQTAFSAVSVSGHQHIYNVDQATENFILEDALMYVNAQNSRAVGSASGYMSQLVSQFTVYMADRQMAIGSIATSINNYPGHPGDGTSINGTEITIGIDEGKISDLLGQITNTKNSDISQIGDNLSAYIAQREELIIGIVTAFSERENEGLDPGCVEGYIFNVVGYGMDEWGDLEDLSNSQDGAENDLEDVANEISEITEVECPIVLPQFRFIPIRDIFIEFQDRESFWW